MTNITIQSIEESIIINASRTTVYNHLKNAIDWPLYLPHVKKIDMLYDDGEYQEFSMDVFSEGDELLHVRSIRRCRNADCIDFFQPKPPEFLKHHSGSWQFKSIHANQCKVITRHQWTLSDNHRHEHTPITVIGLLSRHAQLALSTWKSIIEAKDTLQQ